MTRGGIRQGAGRKKGSNFYGESTTPIRVPISPKQAIKKYLEEQVILKKESNILHPLVEHQKEIPLFSNTVSAGFPSSANDDIDRMLDLNEHLISQQETTFFLRVKGDSMIDAQISEGDLLIVDKSITPKDNDIVIAVVYGDVTVKRLIMKKECIFLKPENKEYPLIPINNPEELVIWGVVQHVIHKVI